MKTAIRVKPFHSLSRAIGALIVLAITLLAGCGGGDNDLTPAGPDPATVALKEVNERQNERNQALVQEDIEKVLIFYSESQVRTISGTETRADLRRALELLKGRTDILSYSTPIVSTKYLPEEGAFELVSSVKITQRLTDPEGLQAAFKASKNDPGLSAFGFHAFDFQNRGEQFQTIEVQETWKKEEGEWRIGSAYMLMEL